VSVLNRWVWKHGFIILHWNCRSVTVMLFCVQSVLSDSFSLWNHVLCLTFFSDSNRFFHTRRCCISTTGRWRASSFGNCYIKTDCYISVCCCFHHYSGWAVYWDCSSAVWHISSWHRRKVLDWFFVRNVWSSIAVFIIASCYWIESSWQFVLFMTLIISTIIGHRKGNLRLKMLLIVRNSAMHVTLQCIRRVESAFCTAFEVQSSPCKL